MYTDGGIYPSASMAGAAELRCRRTGRGSFAGHDPYCELHKGLAHDTRAALAAEGRTGMQGKSRYGRPVVIRGMGERTVHDEQAIVRTTHTACVLSEEVADRSRAEVRAF